MGGWVYKAQDFNHIESFVSCILLLVTFRQLKHWDKAGCVFFSMILNQIYRILFAMDINNKDIFHVSHSEIVYNVKYV